MGTLYLDRQDLALRREGRALVVYANGQRQTSVPIGLVDRLVLRGSVALDSALLGFLAEAGVGLVALGGRAHSQVAVVCGSPRNDAERRVAQYRLHSDPAWRLYWSRRLVSHKLGAQARLLRTARRERPDRRFPLTQGLETLARLRTRLQETGTLDLDQIRGLEGAGAAAYFGAFATLFPAALEFTGRNRRPPRDPVNALLSLGYTLLHAEATLASHAAGLDPLVGFFHELDFGRESLAADLIEPLRPRIDHLVWTLLRNETLRGHHFSRQGEACLLDKEGRAIFYPAFEIAIRPLRRLLRRYLGRLAVRLPRFPTPFVEGQPR